MSVVDADQLQQLLEAGGREAWPIPSERGVISRLQEWGAFMDSNAVVLQRLADWQAGRDQHLPYIVDPLPERIAQAFSDLIFGAETDFETPATEEPAPDGRTTSKPGPDQELLDEIVEDNSLPSELQSACGRCVGEGEVWWRIYVDRDAFEHPVIEWHSRADVIPLFRGKKLLAAAFVSDLSNLAPDAPVVDAPIRVGDSSDPEGQLAWLQQSTVRDDGTVYRYVEIQTGGLTRNLLYQGTRTTLGNRQPLTAHAQTADLPDEWPHALEALSKTGRPVPVMLAGRVTNGGTATRLGRSQYAGVRWLLYELNKVRSVGSRNVELTMQKRAVLNADVIDGSTRIRDETTGKATQVTVPDAFIAPRDQMGDGQPMGVLEFSDAWADALIAWVGEMTDTILTRCRVAPQLIGRHVEAAATGPALRARLLDSVLAADGKARAWDDELPRALRAAQLVDALPEEQGGCGHDWAAPEELPVVVRTSVLPEDETEEVNRHSIATKAGLEARRTAIHRLNAGWSDERVDQEIAMIDADTTFEQAVTIRAPGTPGGLVRSSSIGVNPAGGNGAGA